MNNAPQPQPTQLADPDMALLFLGSWFATLHDAPKRNHAKLNALAWHILAERPKTLLGLAIKACAEKWLRQRLWMVGFDFLLPSEQHACVVIEIATRLGHGQAAEAKAPLQFTFIHSGGRNGPLVWFFPITQSATVLGTHSPSGHRRGNESFFPWSAPWVLAPIFLFLHRVGLARWVLGGNPASGRSSKVSFWARRRPSHHPARCAR